MPGVRELGVEFRAALADAEPGACTPAACAEMVEELALTEKACEAARLRYVARAAECGEHRKRGYADAHDWVARTAGSTVGDARIALSTIKKVATHPEIHDALVAGAVSVAQASAIVSAPAQHETELLELAKTSSLGRVREEAQKRRLAAMDVEELHARRQAAREFVHWKDDQLGMICGRFALPPEQGLPLINRLDRATDQRWRDSKRRGLDLTREQCAADALAALPRRGSKGGASRADVVFVVNPAAYARGHALPGEACHVIGGGPIPVSVVRKHAMDAFIKVAFHDATTIDSIIHYGRRRPALLQSALELGDPPHFEGVTCAVAGCERRYRTEWDHEDPVANGGPTTRGNLSPKCGPHHWEKTEQDRRDGKLGKKQQRKERGP